MATADEIFMNTVYGLPQSEKLRLATLILDELSKTAGPVLDFSDTWTADDTRDVATYSQRYASEQFPE